MIQNTKSPFSASRSGEYYNALVNRDESYVGVFIAAVKTTGIYCLASCSARKPLKKNVHFYSTVEQAIANGFRACKVCEPKKIVNQHKNIDNGLF